MKSIVAGALLVAGSVAAYAIDEDNADVLVPYCLLSNADLVSADRVTAMLNADCYGIVAGVRASLDRLRVAQATGQATLGLCAEVPADIPLERIVRSVATYIRAHPAEGPRRLSMLALSALHNAWPCRPREAVNQKGDPEAARGIAADRSRAQAGKGPANPPFPPPLSIVTMPP
jgi:hypothetical protein